MTNESDSLPMIMAACIGFWVASATISAGIAGIMKLAGASSLTALLQQWPPSNTLYTHP